MQSLNFSELKVYCPWLKGELLEAQLQEVWTNGEILAFEFYRSSELYLCIDTRMQAPAILLLKSRPQIEKNKKPVSLFLNSHAKNLRLKDIELQEDKGRVISILLASAKKECLIEVQLIPKNFNLQVIAGDKKISWNQIKTLPPAVDISMKVEERDGWQYGEEWYSAFTGRGSAPSTGKTLALPKDPRIKDIEKKQKALKTIRETLTADEGQIWRELGESLKATSEVPPHLVKLYDGKKSRSWNMENAFTKMKSIDRKRKGTEERALVVEKEIAKLEKSLALNPEWGGTPLQTVKKVSSGNKLLNKAESKGRKKIFADGIEAVIGKSAAENLAILRHAQAWDLWLHLKDFPGAHAIITRPRNKNVPPEIIREVSEWLIQQTFSGKRMILGAKYDVVVVETRFVRPIKGDKLGRVNYHNPQVFSFASKTEN